MPSLHALALVTFLLWDHMAFHQGGPPVKSELEESRLDLNGRWSIRFDPKNVGLREGWFKGIGDKVAAIEVPSVWETIREGAGYDGVAWYEQSIKVPESFKGKNLFLEFDAVNYACRVWWNRVEVGAHEGGYHGFRVPLGDNVDFSKPNRVVIRVVDPGRLPVDGLTLNSTPHGKESWYFNFGGIWGPVRLVALPDVTIEDVFVTADPKTGKAVAEIEIARRSGKSNEAPVKVNVAARKNSGKSLAETERRVKLTGESTRIKVELGVENPTKWSPDEPFLYRLTATLGESSRRSVDFGFRSFTVEDGDFVLNGERIFIRGVVYQPYYPKTLARPESDDFVRREVDQIKHAGFNLVRFHQGIAPPAFLEQANEKGLLVLEEPPLGWLRAPLDETAKPCIAEMEATVQRDRNHPCIVAWGTTSQGGGNLGQMVDLLARRAQQLDPTRPVFGDWPSRWAEANTDACKVYLPGRNNAEAIASGQIFPPAPITDETREQLSTVGTTASLVFVSAIGSGGITNLRNSIEGFRDGDFYQDKQLYESYLKTAEEGIRANQINDLVGNVDNLCSRAQRAQGAAALDMIEALRANPRVDGYCYSQWRDAAWESGPGVVDVWGQYKQCSDSIRQANQPLCVTLAMRPDSTALDRPIESISAVVNDAGLSGVFNLNFVLRRPDNREVRAVKMTVRLDKDRRVTPLEPIEWRVEDATGYCHLRVEMKDSSGKKVAENEKSFLYLDAKMWDLSQFDLQDFDLTARHRSVLAASGLRLAASLDQPETKTSLVSADGRIWKDRARFEALADALTEIDRQGGTLIIECTGKLDPALERLGLIGGKTVRTARGFLGKFFFMRQSSRFGHLPAYKPMDSEFQTLTPDFAIIPTDPGWESQVAVIDGYGRFVGHAWIEKRWGAGRIVVMTLPVFDRIDRDPTARLICANTLNFYKHNYRPGNPREIDRQILLDRFDGKTQIPPPGSSIGRAPTAWWVCGPFTGESMQAAFRTAYGPEREFDIQKTYAAPGNRMVKWTRFTSPEEGRINFAQALGDTSNCAGFAVTHIVAARATPTTLRLGSDDAIRVYLNGHKIFENETLRAAAADQDRVNIMLKEGVNRLMLKVVNGTSAWEAYVSLDVPVSWSADPPKDSDAQ